MDGESESGAMSWISRIESEANGTFGWQVRMQRRGERVAKFFADRRHGGAAAALESARLWRDAVRRRLEEVGAARVCGSSVRNSSGVVGVSRITISGPNGLQYFFWQATWFPAPGERRCVRFSIRRHGESEAFRLAVEARGGGTASA